MALSLEGHTARAFDGDLSALHIQAVAMGALVIEQVQVAVNAYSGWDRSSATLVLERERRVNLYDAEIEEAALQLIARRQPMAQDLRAVFAIEERKVIPLSSLTLSLLRRLFRCSPSRTNSTDAALWAGLLPPSFWTARPSPST